MPKKQPQNLTIRLAGKTENVLLSTLINVANETLQILREIDKEISHDENGSLEWEVENITLNSPLAIDVKPVIKASPFDERQKVVTTYVTGINVLNTRRTKPRYFNDRALKHAKQLVETYDDGALRIQYTVGEKTVEPKRRIISHVDAILSPPVLDEMRDRRPRTEIGMLQGIVTVLKAGQYDSFTIRESLNNTEVKCSFGDALEEKVRSVWKKRVRAFGKISYTADGVPLDILVDDIRELGAVENLPQFKDFGIDIAGGIDSVDYIRSMRDAE